MWTDTDILKEMVGLMVKEPGQTAIWFHARIWRKANNFLPNFYVKTQLYKITLESIVYSTIVKDVRDFKPLG